MKTLLTSECIRFKNFILKTTLLSSYEYENLNLLVETILNEVEVDGLSEYEAPDLVAEYSEKLGLHPKNVVIAFHDYSKK